MYFGLDKCVQTALIERKMSLTIKLGGQNFINVLEPGVCYKYLVVWECDGMKHSVIEGLGRREYYQ